MRGGRVLKFNKNIAFLMTVVMVILQVTSGLNTVSFGASQVSLGTVIDKGLESSSKISTSHIKIFEKKIAIKQARKSVKGEGLKLIRLFAKKTTFNKDIARKTKVQKAQFEHQLAIKELDSVILAERYRFEEAYLKLFLLQEEIKKKSIRLEEAKARLQLGKEQLRKGLATQGEYDGQRGKVSGLQDEVSSLKLQYANDMTTLGEEIGMTLNSQSHNVSYDMKSAYVAEWLLPSVLEEAIDNDWSLISTGENIDYMTFYVDAIASLYNSKFSSGRMSSLNSLINGGIGEIGDLELMSSYENLIDGLISRYGEKWKAYLEIPLLFITIKIPKFFRSDEFDGVRYLEDARYVLMSEIFKTKQLITVEEDLRKAKITYVTDLFSQINNLDYEYITMGDSYRQLSASYAIDQQSYSKGLIEADILLAKNTELIALDQKIFDTLASMNEKILEMDYITGGYYSGLVSSEIVQNSGIKPAPFKKPSVEKLMKELDKMAAANQELNVSWTLKPLAETINSEFKIKVAGKTPVTHYQVFNTDGLKLSDKLSVKESFIHLDLLFSEKRNLQVKLFNQDKLIFTTRLVGYGEKGVLEVRTP